MSSIADRQPNTSLGRPCPKCGYEMQSRVRALKTPAYKCVNRDCEFDED